MNETNVIIQADSLKLMADMPESSVDLVLDPFAGAGATAMACAITGRRWVCIEKEREYVDIARRRLAGGVQAELCTANNRLSKLDHPDAL